MAQMRAKRMKVSRLPTKHRTVVLKMRDMFYAIYACYDKENKKDVFIAISLMRNNACSIRYQGQMQLITQWRGKRRTCATSHQGKFD